MKKGESRFFINWQINKDEAQLLHESSSDKERTSRLEKWIARNSELVTAASIDDESHWAVIVNFFENNFDLARAAKFSQLKMSCFLEIMLYLIKQMLLHRLPEEQSFSMFKELLLRHSVQRPPHSLAIFNLEDVKAINEHVQDTYFRFYNMYLYSLTQDQLIILTTEKQCDLEEPPQPRLGEGRQIPPREIEGDIR